MASWRYSCSTCGKTYFGPQLPGRMECNCDPAKQISGTRIQTPLSEDLTEIVSVSEAATRRDVLCTRWGISNKSHASHGSNFSSNQTMVNLIHNIIAPVKGDLYTSVKQKIKDDYLYDIEAREMTY